MKVADARTGTRLGRSRSRPPPQQQAQSTSTADLRGGRPAVLMDGPRAGRALVSGFRV